MKIIQTLLLKKDCRTKSNIKVLINDLDDHLKNVDVDSIFLL